MARPKLELDTEMIEKLAAVGCSDKDNAYIMKCSVDTINRRFQEYLDAGRARGRTRLRNKQYEVAMSGNTAMLIWLGKQMLGQSDRQEVKTSGTISSVTEVVIGGYKEIVNEPTNAEQDIPPLT